MKDPAAGKLLGCAECAGRDSLGFELTMAFQPIVDLRNRCIFAQEALVRGPNNEPAGEVFARVDDSNIYRFDQACRTRAIQQASELHLDSLLSINFMPNAVYRPELCIRNTLAAAEQFSFPIDRIIFEITEGEKIEDHQHLRGIVDYYRKLGFKVAMDDFGAGYSGLNLLADIPVDLLKLDMALIRHVDQDRVREAIIKGIVRVCEELDIRVIAEGIESDEELRCLQHLGIELFQGFYFARPAFNALAEVSYS
ncbi:EAL domain-containing protein [Proteobacteria bacterium 005FR1]|nr:EAL domain-containing protein [Proteobacteria bacterium 005FR1]